jgi:ribose transport system substrate-binding protein
MRRFNRRSWYMLIAGMVLALFASACSSGTSSGSSATQPSGSSATQPSSDAASGGGAAYAEQQVAQYRSVPAFKAPGPPVDVSKVKGKSVFVIPLVPNPFNQSIQNTMQYLANKAGIKYTIYPNQGLVSQWVQAFNQAIAQKPNLIILSTAPDPRELQPQLQAAKKAGIPVLVTHFYDKSSPPPPKCLACAAGVTALETAPFYEAGKAEADWMIADSAGKAHVLIVSSNDILPSPPTVAVIEKELKEHCPDCTYSDVNVPVSDWNTKVGSTVEAQLQQHPDINYVDCLYDAMVQTAVPAVQLAGKAGQVKVVSYNGSTFALKYIQDGNIMGMDVGEPTVWIGYAVMDQAFRILSGQDALPNETTPIRIWDKSNISEAGTPPSLTQGYGDAYVAGYNKLWGVNWPSYTG